MTAAVIFSVYEAGEPRYGMFTGLIGKLRPLFACCAAYCNIFACISEWMGRYWKVGCRGTANALLSGFNDACA